MKIIILGECPSKKNSRILSMRGNRPMSFPGGNYTQWHKGASNQLLAFKKGLSLPISPVEHIFMTFFPGTHRKSDLTNKAESVMDLLVDNTFLEDDNWFVCGKISLKFGGVNTKNPRVEIEIT